MIEIIAAVDENYGIGKDGKLPWHFSADMQFFKKTTKDYPMIMGNNTWESFEKPLKGRTHIVISRKKRGCMTHPEPIYFYSINGFFSNHHNSTQKYFLIGGGQIYEKFLDMDVVKHITLTRIPGKYECDTFFPSVYLKGFGMFEQKEIDNGLIVQRYVRKVY